MSKPPERTEVFEPGFSFESSYSSYETQNHLLRASGKMKGLDCSLAYRHYRTDGYLRSNEADKDTVSGKLGYKLASDGYVSLLGTYSDLNYEVPVANDPAREDYDPDYPVVDEEYASYLAANDPSRTKDPYLLRLDAEQPTSFGTWKLGIYRKYEDQTYHFDPENLPRRARSADTAETDWLTWAGKIQNEIVLFKDHHLSIGFDFAKLYMDDDGEDKERERTLAGFIQDKWEITPRLTLTAGLRYDEITIWWYNENVRTGEYCLPVEKEDIEKDYVQFVPKSFLTYDLDGLAESLRDTSISLGVSRIWTPREFCSVCSWGSGVEADPLHGYVYDLVISRRLWKDINLRTNFYYYEMEDYTVWADSSSSYFKDSPWSRRMRDLEDIVKQGLELELNGHILDNLVFNLGYSYQDWDYDGVFLEAAEELSDRADHKVNAGLRYRPWKSTLLILDYMYQDEQVAHIQEEDPPDSGNIVSYENPMDSFHVFDFAVEQRLLKDKRFIRKLSLKLSVQNLFDEDYEQDRGFPMTDRTYGVALKGEF